MAWTKLGTTTLTTSGDGVVVDSMTEKKFVFFMSHCLTNGSNIGGLQQLNGDSGNNYSSRMSDNGSESTQVSQTYLYSDWNPSTPRDIFMIGYISNISTEEKLIITQTSRREQAGSGYAPSREEHVGKYSDTSNSMTELRMHNIEAGDFDTDSNLSVLGTD